MLKKGGIWQFQNWKVIYDYHLKYKAEDCDEHDIRSCKHAVKLDKPENTYSIPFIVVATNEGGYCTTGVCMQCIVEKV